MAGGSGGPPKLDGRNYAYWKARMAGYLEAINPIAWAVTEKPIVGPWNEDQVKYGARAKNALFDALSEEIFARVHSKKTSHEIWEALEAIYVGSKKLREEKYQVLKEKLNEFKMLPNELVEQMYARLNVLVEDINALEFLLCLLVTSSGRSFIVYTSQSTTSLPHCSMRRILKHLK